MSRQKYILVLEDRGDSAAERRPAVERLRGIFAEAVQKAGFKLVMASLQHEGFDSHRFADAPSRQLRRDQRR